MEYYQQEGISVPQPPAQTLPLWQERIVVLLFRSQHILGVLSG